MSQTNPSPSDMLDQIAHALNGKKTGNGYDVQCPCHDDRHQSLSISKGNKAPIVWRCQAGCNGKDVQKKLEEILGFPIYPKKGSVSQMPNAQPEAIYQYALNGVVLYEKVRWPDKIFRAQHLHTKHDAACKEREERFKKPCANLNKIANWKPEAPTILYYQDKLDRLRGRVPVIVCEGEKDCDRLNKLLGDEYVAVTNDGGGASWNAQHGVLLQNCDIIIAEDFDKAGRERTQQIKKVGGYKSLIGALRFKEGEVELKGDVSDWLDAGHSVEELKERLKNGLEEAANVVIKTGKPKGTPDDTEYASYEDYIKIIRDYKPKIDKCIFSGKIMYQDEDSIWKPLSNKLGVIRSRVREAGSIDFKTYSPQAVNDHFDEFADSIPPRLLVDIPVWDGKDRIMEMAMHIRLNPEAKVSELCFMALTKEWLANVFRKLKDPTMDTSPSREFILILTGKEKIGKDYWIRSLLCGLGQYFSPMSISHNERDNLMQLHLGLVLNLAEFDQTSRLQSSFIKDIVTKSSTNMRGTHARDEEFRFSRTNFIASANMSDLLRDSGANTRYAIFELEDINRDYTKNTEYSLQILAQAKKLAEDGFVAPDDLWKEMREFITDMTPESANKQVADLYKDSARTWYLNLDLDTKKIVKERGFATNKELFNTFVEMSKKLGTSVRKIGMSLTAQKLQRRNSEARGYIVDTSEIEKSVI